MTWLLLGLALLVGGVSQSATDAARPRARQGIPGAPVFMGSDWRSGINGAGQVAQVGTIVVDTATDSATYTFTINGITISFVNGTSSTTTTVAALVAAAINAEPRVRGQVSASASVATVTLTATRLGTAGAFTASDSDAKLTTTEASTAAADASTMGFGLACIQTAYNPAPTGAPLAGTEKIIAVPKTTLFTAQVQTVAITYVSTAVIVAEVWEVRGTERHFVAAAKMISATDRDTTIDGLVTALEAAMPANTVSFAADNATGTAIVGTAEIAGYEFDLVVFQSDVSTAPTFTKTNTTGPSEATSLNRAWRGITKYAEDREAATLTSTSGSYPANSLARYTAQGVVWVTSAQTPASGDTVYVELAAGSTQGRFYTDASSTRVALSRRLARWERDGLVTTDSLAAIRLEA